jgi:hypothetical protein
MNAALEVKPKPSCWPQRVCLLVLVMCSPGRVLGAKSAEVGPPCDKTQKLYKQSKLYEVLGVGKRASAKEIKRAFKKMSIKCRLRRQC